MIDKLQLTLYEIFGYLLPGVFATAALSILYWAACLPAVAFPAYKASPNAVAWAALTVVAYLLGHLAQGLGNTFLKGAENAALGVSGSVPAAIVSSAKSRAAAIMNVTSGAIDSPALFRIADEFSVQKGSLGDRDIFVYREGFYKGCAVALALLCIALTVRAFRDDCALQFPTFKYFVSRNQLLFAALLTAGAARVCKQRFHRFGMYRVTRALFAFLVLSQDEKKLEKKTDV